MGSRQSGNHLAKMVNRPTGCNDGKALIMAKRETMHTLSDEILSHLRNLTTPHETEARVTLPAGITLARAINYGTVARVSASGRRGLIATRDDLAQWRKCQYRISPERAALCALVSEWPSESDDAELWFAAHSPIL